MKPGLLVHGKTKTSERPRGSEEIAVSEKKSAKVIDLNAHRAHGNRKRVQWLQFVAGNTWPSTNETT